LTEGLLVNKHTYSTHQLLILLAYRIFILALFKLLVATATHILIMFKRKRLSRS